ncbi:MAG: DUF72 domain-containing protein [Candidatus Bathyarchaeota archaeon]|nr:DUF72 domain-containing protein [Candidatus Bathyarchaeota archaeon]
MIVKVGCCGFPVAKKRYYEVFKVVEVNSTFYTYPKSSVLDRWKMEAPKDFEFVLKAHQDISHKHRLKPTKDCLKSLRLMSEACKTLNSKLLLIQTPGSLKPSEEVLDSVEKFFNVAVKNGELKYAWETRGDEWFKPEVKVKLKKILEKFDVSHCVDPLKSTPIFVKDFAYFRLHGLSERLYYYQYSDEELKKLLSVVESFNGIVNEAYVFFNNLSMFTDALRFLTIVKTGNPPSLTGCYGQESLKKVLENIKFPISKSMLIKKYGWKLFDLEPGKQVTLEKVLKNVPGNVYSSLEKLLKDVNI